MNKHQSKLLLKLSEMLNDTIKNNDNINIHVKTNDFEMHDTLVLEQSEITEEAIIVSKGNLDIFINIYDVNEFDVQYINDDDSFYIRCDDLEIYFDFIY